MVDFDFGPISKFVQLFSIQSMQSLLIFQLSFQKLSSATFVFQASQDQLEFEVGASIVGGQFYSGHSQSDLIGNCD